MTQPSDPQATPVLEGVRALVTGGTSGLGFAMTRALAEAGARVALTGRTDQRVQEAATRIGRGARVTGLVMDVRDEQSVCAGVDRALAAIGGVDVLVNNAGFALSGPIEVLADADVRRQFGTNVFGLLTVTRTVLPAMRSRGSGSIINISSLVGRTTFRGMGVYGATKYAVEALSDALRQEVAGFGIKVVIIEPGFVATSLGEAADGRPTEHEETSGAYAAMTATGERYAASQIAKGIAPEKVAAAIVNAAEHPSPRARYVVPGSARALIVLLTTLPDKLADRAKQRAVAGS